MDDSTSRVIEAFGPRLRAMRLRRSFTLQQLSAASGISVSTLSRLESGLRLPNLAQLLPLAAVFELPLDELVGAPSVSDPRIHLRPMSRHGQVIVPLSPDAAGLTGFKHVISASSPLEQPSTKVHQGHEWLYVLKGRLGVVLGGDSFELEAGEAIEFDTRTPHWFGRTSSGAVEFLSLFGRQGERMRVRTRNTGG